MPNSTKCCTDCSRAHRAASGLSRMAAWDGASLSCPRTSRFLVACVAPFRFPRGRVAGGASGRPRIYRPPLIRYRLVAAAWAHSTMAGALVVLALDTGLRVAELGGVRGRDLDGALLKVEGPPRA